MNANNVLLWLFLMLVISFIPNLDQFLDFREDFIKSHLHSIRGQVQDLGVLLMLPETYIYWDVSGLPLLYIPLIRR